MIMAYSCSTAQGLYSKELGKHKLSEDRDGFERKGHISSNAVMHGHTASSSMIRSLLTVTAMYIGGLPMMLQRAIVCTPMPFITSGVSGVIVLFKDDPIMMYVFIPVAVLILFGFAAWQALKFFARVPIAFEDTEMPRPRSNSDFSAEDTRPATKVTADSGHNTLYPGSPKARIIVPRNSLTSTTGDASDSEGDGQSQSDVTTEKAKLKKKVKKVKKKKRI